MRKQFLVTYLFIFSFIEVFLFFSIYSYNSSDISLNTVVYFEYPAKQVVDNLFGLSGAYIADRLFTFWGFATFLLPLLLFNPLILSYRMLFKNNEVRSPKIVLAIIGTILLVFLASVFLNLVFISLGIDVFSTPGGVVGLLINIFTVGLVGEVGGIIACLFIFPVFIAIYLGVPISQSFKIIFSPKEAAYRLFEIFRERAQKRGGNEAFFNMNLFQNESSDTTETKQNTAEDEANETPQKKQFFTGLLKGVGRKNTKKEDELEPIQVSRKNEQNEDYLEIYMRTKEKEEEALEQIEVLSPPLDSIDNLEDARETPYVSDRESSAATKHTSDDIPVKRYPSTATVEEQNIATHNIYGTESLQIDTPQRDNRNIIRKEPPKKEPVKSLKTDPTADFLDKITSEVIKEGLLSKSESIRLDSKNTAQVANNSSPKSTQNIDDKNNKIEEKAPVYSVFQERIIESIDMPDQDEVKGGEVFSEVENPLLSRRTSSKRELFSGEFESLKIKSVEDNTPQKAEPVQNEIEPKKTADIVVEKPQEPKKPAKVQQRSKKYELPTEMLISTPESKGNVDIESNQEVWEEADILNTRLNDFGVRGRITDIEVGPIVTTYLFEPAPGVKVNKITGLGDDIALALHAETVRIVAPVPGRGAVGFEVANQKKEIVYFKEIIESKQFKESKNTLTIALGKDVLGKPFITDLAKMPHILVAGSTGTGKSVAINTMICSILYKSSPKQVGLILVDPKMVELSAYEDIPHLMTPVITDPKKASAALRNVVREMEERYAILQESKVRNILSYNLSIKGTKKPAMKYLVVVVDEFADLMMVAGKDVEKSIIRIAQMARAVGIHLIIATQRPSVDVITGLIKANMTSRLAFRVASKIDSRTILDRQGAEDLLGQGDSLLIDSGKEPVRVHGSFIREDEVLQVTDHLRSLGEPQFDMSWTEQPVKNSLPTDDELDSEYEEALEFVMEKGFASISMIQRYLKIGYNKAARIIETMEARGIVGPSTGSSRTREVLKRR